MSNTVESSPALEDGRPESIRLSCAQIRGGNGAIFAPVEMPGIDGVVLSQPSEGESGGDVYYVSICGSGLLSRFCVADVVGHGETVSAVSTAIHRAMQRLMNWTDHRRVLRRLNRLLLRKGLSAMTTMAIMTYYPPTRRLTFSYAGHLPAWYYQRSNQTWRRLVLEQSPADESVNHNCVLAVVPNAAFARGSHRVEPGDRLLVVTDGVLETFGADQAHFGTDGVESVLQTTTGQSVEQVARELVNSARRFSSDPELSHDDMTVLLLEFTEGPAGSTLGQVVRNRVLRPLGRLG